MREPVYLRGAIWWCRVRNKDGGKHIRVSTGCKSRAAAVRRWQELERLTITPAHKAEAETPLGDAIDRRIAERKAAGRSAGTVKMLTQKGRQLNRVMGSETPLAKIDAKAVDEYIATRLSEGASRSTIYKELSTLRGTLKLAIRRGEFSRHLDAIMPIDFSAAYEPKKRALSIAEVSAILRALPVHRAAVVAFIVATGATYPSELAKLVRSDVNTVNWTVHLKGTKTKTRDRVVPVARFAQPWLTQALPYVPFAPWGNVRRDLHAACLKAGIPPCSPNDLRRTLGVQLRARGVEPSLIGLVLGHADSRMVERVYGRIAPEQLAHLLRQRLRENVGANRGPIKARDRRVSSNSK